MRAERARAHERTHAHHDERKVAGRRSDPCLRAEKRGRRRHSDGMRPLRAGVEAIRSPDDRHEVDVPLRVKTVANGSQRGCVRGQRLLSIVLEMDEAVRRAELRASKHAMALVGLRVSVSGASRRSSCPWRPNILAFAPALEFLGAAITGAMIG